MHFLLIAAAAAWRPKFIFLHRHVNVNSYFPLSVYLDRGWREREREHNDIVPNSWLRKLLLILYHNDSGCSSALFFLSLDFLPSSKLCPELYLVLAPLLSASRIAHHHCRGQQTQKSPLSIHNSLLSWKCKTTPKSGNGPKGRQKVNPAEEEDLSSSPDGEGNT